MSGTRVAETILASVHVRARLQAGHMDASDLIKLLQNDLAWRGPSTYGVSTPIGVVNPLIFLLATGSLLGAYSQCRHRRVC